MSQTSWQQDGLERASFTSICQVSGSMAFFAFKREYDPHNCIRIVHLNTSVP